MGCGDQIVYFFSSILKLHTIETPTCSLSTISISRSDSLLRFGTMLYSKSFSHSRASRTLLPGPDKMFKPYVVPSICRQQFDRSTHTSRLPQQCLPTTCLLTWDRLAVKSKHMFSGAHPAARFICCQKKWLKFRI